MQTNKIFCQFSFDRFPAVQIWKRIVSWIVVWSPICCFGFVSYFLPLIPSPSHTLYFEVRHLCMIACIGQHIHTQTQAHAAKALPSYGTQQSNNTTMKFHWMKLYQQNANTRTTSDTDTCIPCNTIAQHSTPTRVESTGLDWIQCMEREKKLMPTLAHTRAYNWNVWFVIEMARQRRGESEKQRVDTHHILRTRNKTPFGFCWFFSMSVCPCVCVCFVCVAVVLFGSYTQHQPPAHSFVLV